MAAKKLRNAVPYILAHIIAFLTQLMSCMREFVPITLRQHLEHPICRCLVDDHFRTGCERQNRQVNGPHPVT